MNQNYIVIDTNQNICVNVIIWDGESDHNPGTNLVAQLSDGTINIGDSVHLVNGSYELLSTFVSSQSAVELFSVNQFVQDLLGAFAGDSNILPYYSVVKDLATYGNFSGMKDLLNEVLAAGKITQDEVNTFNGVLMNQDIDLSKF